MTMHPDLDDLALLVLVAETGSIGQTALRRGLSQPSVSRRMGALERTLGVPLLERTTRGTTLTAPGRVVVDWASSLLHAAEDFNRSVQTLGARSRSALRAAGSMTIAEHHAPRWIGQLRQRLPGTKVSLTVANSADVTALVDRRKVDVGFVESPSVARGGLRTRRIGSDSLAVAVPPGHRWVRRTSITAEELAAAEVLVREVGSGTRETLEEELQQRGLALKPALELASNTALKSAALAGMGPVAVSELAVAEELDDGQLVRVAVRDLELSRPLTAVWHAQAGLSSAARALVAVAGGH